jgi:baculoviral IAP repeat-containing protein 6
MLSLNSIQKRADAHIVFISSILLSNVRFALSPADTVDITDNEQSNRTVIFTRIIMYLCSSDQLLVNKPALGMPQLHLLHELTKYENLSPCYAATVPPCWSEMMQAQKQRRHPQHLQQGDDLQHTRSWRLQNDA